MRNVIARSLVPAVVLTAGLAHGGDFAASQHRQQPRYQVTNLSSLGGTISRGNSINNAGWVTGYSNLAGDQARHASLWRYGSQFDLGTLGGPNSSVAWPVKNNIGIIAGIWQTATPDPLGENWSCSAFFPGATATGPTCVGFVWTWGVMRALPTLGGNNGFATGANNRGQVVGWAENALHDPTCVPPQVLQFRAVIWGPGRNQIRQLNPLAGDTSTAATAINDNGQVVGISGTCDQAVGRYTAAHAVLWENGSVTDIGPRAKPPKPEPQATGPMGPAGIPSFAQENPCSWRTGRSASSSPRQRGALDHRAEPCDCPRNAPAR
jgi:probable HAF family extracellular repeat protein